MLVIVLVELEWQKQTTRRGPLRESEKRERERERQRERWNGPQLNTKSQAPLNPVAGRAWRRGRRWTSLGPFRPSRTSRIAQIGDFNPRFLKETYRIWSHFPQESEIENGGFEQATEGRYERLPEKGNSNSHGARPIH